MRIIRSTLTHAFSIICFFSLFLMLQYACAFADNCNFNLSRSGFQPFVSFLPNGVLGSKPFQSELNPHDKPLDNDLWDGKENLLDAVEHSLEYLYTPEARRDYNRIGSLTFTWDRVLQSMEHFRYVLLKSHSAAELDCLLKREFVPVRVGGSDGKGTVRFTGYFQPVYQASKIPTSEFRFPIYRRPPNFEKWPLPHPTRVELEGFDGFGASQGPLRGLELAWFRSRYEAFMVGVQGSAILQFTDGTQHAIGFAEGLNHPFIGISSQVMKEYGVSYPQLKTFFDSHAKILNQYLANNNRLIFFKENPLSVPIGSLGVPVIPDRSIATDKRQMPPGALALINTSLPLTRRDGGLSYVKTTRIVVDHDTGSAIKGPGRVDIFMGTGREAQRKASSMYATGELSYLMLREEL